MTTSTVAEDKRARRAFVWIAVVALLLFAALSGAWLYLAGRLDAAAGRLIAEAAGRGLTIACDGRKVFGYPFRLGLSCDAVGLDVPPTGLKATGGTLKTAGQIYDPTRIVAELGAPLRVDPPDGPPLDLRWDLAQASVHLWTAGLDRVSLVLEAPEIALAEPAGGRRPLARSDHLEAHLRRRGEAIDVALTDRGVAMLEPVLAQVPRFDVFADATVEGAADWLAGGLAGRTLGQGLAGKAGTIRALRIALAAPAAAGPAAKAAVAELSGPFQVAGDGRLSGDFTLALTDPQAIAGLVASLSPEFAGLAGTVASAVSFAGKLDDKGRTVIAIGVRDGVAAMGFVPLGTIPPLR